MGDRSGLGSATQGVWSRATALDVMTRGEVDAAVRRGEWQVPWPGVYADAGHELDAEQRALAAVIASGDVRPERVAEDQESLRLRAVAAGRTAGRVWSLPLVDDDDPATGACERLLEDVVVWNHGRTLRRPDAWGRARVLQRRRARFVAGEVVQRPSGLWLMSPARTLLDLAGRIADDALVCAVDDALHRGLVTSPELHRTADDHRAHRHVGRLREALRRADGRAESPGETLTRLLLQPDLPGLVPQVRVFAHDARLLAVLDLADEDLLLAVEFDGRRGHAGELMVAKDRRRDAATTAQGWTTERVVWFEVRRRQEQTRRRILATAERLRQARRISG